LFETKRVLPFVFFTDHPAIRTRTRMFSAEPSAKAYGDHSLRGHVESNRPKSIRCSRVPFVINTFPELFKPRPHLTNILQTFGQTFVKHPKYPTHIFVEYLLGMDVLPNNFVCKCHNYSKIMAYILWETRWFHTHNC
jgi:hypothetical protein